MCYFSRPPPKIQKIVFQNLQAGIVIQCAIFAPKIKKLLFLEMPCGTVTKSRLDLVPKLQESSYNDSKYFDLVDCTDHFYRNSGNFSKFIKSHAVYFEKKRKFLSKLPIN